MSLDIAKTLTLRLHILGTQTESEETEQVRDELDTLCLSLTNEEMAILRKFIVETKIKYNKKENIIPMETKTFVIVVTTDTGNQYVRTTSAPEKNVLTAFLTHAMMGEEKFMEHTAKLHAEKDTGKKFEVAEIVLTVPKTWLR